MTVLARGSRGARSEDVRRGNLSTLLRYVHVHGPTPRSTLTTVLGLNRSTIGDLTGELVAAGLVYEGAGRPDRVVDGSSGSGGRPSFVVRPATDRVQVLAVDVGVTHLTVARVGLGGDVLARQDRAYRRGARPQRDVTATIAKVGARLLAEIESEAVVVAAGVAVPGMVRRRDGQVRQAPNLGWRDAPLGAQLAEALGLPVAVGNDADLGIRAEHVRGAAAGVDDAVYLSGHSGIGAGILAGGIPLGGRAGLRRGGRPHRRRAERAAVPLRVARLLGDPVRRGATVRAGRPASRWRPGRRAGRRARGGRRRRRGEGGRGARRRLARARHRQRRQRTQPRDRHHGRGAGGGPAGCRPDRACRVRGRRAGRAVRAGAPRDPGSRTRLDPGGRRRAGLRRRCCPTRCSRCPDVPLLVRDSRTHPHRPPERRTPTT